jgi:demethylmenaquinone methyltransferase/2-methoxy-6-polyprenyl-1,4-benzoquinol methylase
VTGYERKIKRRFRFMALFYDFCEPALGLSRRQNPRQALASKIPEGAPRILDVCTGTATSAIALARTHPRSEIVGVDLSPDMLAIAQDKLRKRGVDNVTIHAMDAAALDFPDGAFDAAAISFGLHEMAYGLMVEVLAETRRVVKDGGRLAIVDWDQEGGLWGLAQALFLKTLEPAHMPQFLRYDWVQILAGVGFHVLEMEECAFSKLISAEALPWPRPR